MAPKPATSGTAPTPAAGFPGFYVFTPRYTLLGVTGECAEDAADTVVLRMEINADQRLSSGRARSSQRVVQLPSLRYVETGITYLQLACSCLVGGRYAIVGGGAGPVAGSTPEEVRQFDRLMFYVEHRRWMRWSAVQRTVRTRAERSVRASMSYTSSRACRMGTRWSSSGIKTPWQF